MTQPIPWFERKFPQQTPEMFTSLLEQLRGTPSRLENQILSITNKHLVIQLAGRWSIQENIGHLLDLEPLWSGRVQDILNGTAKLRTTDLTNAATTTANHNAKDVRVLLEDFRIARTAFVNTLEQISQENLGKTALHPRLNTPMSIVDKMFFVAEHDDYHIATIRAILQTLQA
jgi:uncharacterized damage-inducible protein DinB